jgi:hypothetical protein
MLMARSRVDGWSERRKRERARERPGVKRSSCQVGKGESGVRREMTPGVSVKIKRSG